MFRHHHTWNVYSYRREYIGQNCALRSLIATVLFFLKLPNYAIVRIDRTYLLFQSWIAVIRRLPNILVYGRATWVRMVKQKTAYTSKIHTNVHTHRASEYFLYHKNLLQNLTTAENRRPASQRRKLFSARILITDLPKTKPISVIWKHMIWASLFIEEDPRWGCALRIQKNGGRPSSFSGVGDRHQSESRLIGVRNKRSRSANPLVVWWPGEHCQVSRDVSRTSFLLTCFDAMVKRPS